MPLRDSTLINHSSKAREEQEGISGNKRTVPDSIYGTKYSRVDQVKIFKGCPPQILHGPFLNALSNI